MCRRDCKCKTKNPKKSGTWMKTNKKWLKNKTRETKLGQVKPLRPDWVLFEVRKIINTSKTLPSTPHA